MIVLGIDQGLGGAVAILSSGTPTSWRRMRNHRLRATPIITGKRKQFDEPGMLHLLERIMREYQLRHHSAEIHAYMEAVQPMPQKPVMAAISQGRSDGLWRMALVAAGVAYTLVSPRKWQNVMLAGVSGTDTKQRSILAAKRLYPHVSLRATSKCRVDNHNFADALLLAEYGRRQLVKTGDE